MFLRILILTNLERKMFNRKLSQLIVTFAFFYSSIVCHLKAIELLEKGNIWVAIFLWFCALSSFLGALRFQIAKLFYKLRDFFKK